MFSSAHNVCVSIVAGVCVCVWVWSIKVYAFPLKRNFLFGHYCSGKTIKKNVHRSQHNQQAAQWWTALIYSYQRKKWVLLVSNRAINRNGFYDPILMNVFVGGLSMHCYLNDVLDKRSAGCFECGMDVSIPGNLARWLNLEIRDVEEMCKSFGDH